MSAHTWQMVAMLALIVGFSLGLVIGGISGRAAQAVLQARQIRQEVNQRVTAHLAYARRYGTPHTRHPVDAADSNYGPTAVLAGRDPR